MNENVKDFLSEVTTLLKKHFKEFNIEVLIKTPKSLKTNIIYDLRTNMHFTLKTNPLRYEDLQDFIKCYNPDNRFDRKETERFKAFTYDELLQRDKVSLDIFWLKDENPQFEIRNPKLGA